MIRIIKGTFGFVNGKTIEPKTKDSAPFSINPKREAELVAMGVAEYVVVEEGTNAKTEAAEEAQEITLERLEGMKLDELKEFAAQYGVEYKVGTKKADFAKAVFAATETGEQPEEDGEQPPTFDAADSVRF